MMLEDTESWKPHASQSFILFCKFIYNRHALKLCVLLKKKTHKSYRIKVRTTTVEKRKCNVGCRSGLNWGSQAHNLPPIWNVRNVWINKLFICCAEICCRICSMLCLDLKDSANDAGSSTEKHSQSLCVHSYERVPFLPSFLERHEAVWRPGEVNVNCYYFVFIYMQLCSKTHSCYLKWSIWYDPQSSCSSFLEFSFPFFLLLQ